jgi:acetyltransferase-like isoleucine patch superfamily enzyme
VNADLLRHYFYVAKRRMRFGWSTAWGYARCAWWSVPLGPGCVFHGKTWFRRFPGSRISLGRGCQLLSSPTANLIGINRPCMISTMAAEAEIRIGNDCGFSGTVIAGFRSIVLGDHVICGANTLITDSNWHPEDPRSGRPSPVRIDDNVWLGVNAIVLRGVSIGTNSVIGAGSIVTSNIPANVIAAGNPCRVIKPLVLTS